MIKKIISLIIFSILFLNLYSQQDTLKVDTLKKTKVKNPIMAVTTSAILPGAGQIYNGKYWKVPFIYGALATSYYYIGKNNLLYQTYRNDLINLDLDSTYHTTTGIYDLEQLTQNRDIFRRKRDLAVLAGAAIWILNVIDAYVDAELSDFDISPDLSLKVWPDFYIGNKNKYTYALTFTFVF